MTYIGDGVAEDASMSTSTAPTTGSATARETTHRGATVTSVATIRPPSAACRIVRARHPPAQRDRGFLTFRPRSEYAGGCPVDWGAGGSGVRVAGVQRDLLPCLQVGELAAQLGPDPGHRLLAQRQPQRRGLVPDRQDDRLGGPHRVVRLVAGRLAEPLSRGAR